MGRHTSRIDDHGELADVFLCVQFRRALDVGGVGPVRRFGTLVCRSRVKSWIVILQCLVGFRNILRQHVTRCLVGGFDSTEEKSFHFQFLNMSSAESKSNCISHYSLNVTSSLVMSLTPDPKRRQRRAK